MGWLTGPRKDSSSLTELPTFLILGHRTLSLNTIAIIVDFSGEFLVKDAKRSDVISHFLVTGQSTHIDQCTMVNLNRMTLDSLWFIVLAIVLEAADQKSVVEGLQ